MRKSRIAVLVLLSVAPALLQACATRLPAAPQGDIVQGSLAVGRAVTLITGARSRIYLPEIRFLEVVNRQTNERYRIDVQSDDRHFLLPLSPGDYELSRVQISEGPFMSMADVSTSFRIGPEPVTHVGTWRFGVDSPKYGRMVAVSMVLEEDDRVDAREFVTEEYPDLQDHPMAEVLPQPSNLEARLYEVAPYPRYPRYFRRHWW